MTIKVVTTGYANGIIISAAMPSEAGTDEYKPWSMDIHNNGDEGIFGGAIINVSGPGSIVVKWDTEETTLPPDPTRGWMIHYIDPQPNCTHLITGGELKFMAEGTYVIQVHGIHQEGTEWWSDDFREFSVVVSGDGNGDGFVSLKGKVTGLLGMAVGNAIVEIDGTKIETNAAGEYLFVSIATGGYKLTVTKEPWYEPYEKDLSLTTPDEEYEEDVSLSLKSYIMYGVPLAVLCGVGGMVYIRKQAAPAIYRAPPGYELIPRTPPGYRMVRD